MRGRIELLERPAIAIVGSRNATAQGLENARAFAAHLGGAGWVVVSGLALGIDGAAHEGALAGGGGTIAVVGTGLDVVYPVRHRALAQKIAADGLLLSEFAVGTPALAENFPIRNRIIAALARGTLVVEAAVQSGSLITARLALEAGRDVFAIPGSIHSPAIARLPRAHQARRQAGRQRERHRRRAGAARGPCRARHRLRRRRHAHRPPRTPSSTRSASIRSASTSLIARTGQSAAELSARLLDLELQGRVARLPGQRFQRVERG